MLGVFEREGDEEYLIAAVRSVDPISGQPQAPPAMTESEAEALRARRRMLFNLDDILEFKRLGYLGEGNDGLLVAFEQELEALRSSDQRVFDLLQALLDEENEDRLTIMGRIVDTIPNLLPPDQRD